MLYWCFHSAELKNIYRHAQIHKYNLQKKKKGTKPTKKNMASGLQVRACPSLQMKVEQVQKSGFAIGIISTNSFCGRISDIGE